MKLATANPFQGLEEFVLENESLAKRTWYKIGGPARWFTGGKWNEGYWFDVMAKDHGEPGNKPGPGNHGSMGPDYYSFTIRKMVGMNQSGAPIYHSEGPFTGGNFQTHPPNSGHPATVGTAPPWVTIGP